MFLFGAISDMIKYWDVDLFDDKNSSKKIMNDSLLCNINIPEVYLCMSFLKKVCINVKYTLEESLNVIRDRFIIIDHEAIRLYWHKYSLNQDRYLFFGNFDPQITLNDWLLLYGSEDSIILNSNY